jgi:indole-3-glycerol phosphate synthase
MTHDVSPVLKKILDHKREEVRLRKSIFAMDEMRKKAADAPKVRPFAGGILASSSRFKVIAEIKRFSPGNKKFRPEFDPVSIAKSYENAGAAAISVLTDTVFFGGSLTSLASVREAVSLPVLCKDFILDPFQIFEARAYGADAVLLMAVNFKSKGEFQALIETAIEAGIEPLLEIHDEGDLDFLPASRPSVMINNRNFRDSDLKLDLDTTKRLAPLIKSARIKISASGFKNSFALEEIEKLGVDSFLIGSSLMDDADPGEALKNLLGRSK